MSQCALGEVKESDSSQNESGSKLRCNLLFTFKFLIKMKQLKFLVFLLGVMSLLVIFSCNKEDTRVLTADKTSDIRTSNMSTIMANRNRFARAFSKAIQNSDFYDFITTECLNSTLNDPEILYSEIYGKSISRLGTTFANYMAHIESTTIVGVTNSSQFYNVTCIETDPLLGVVVMPGRLNAYSTIGTIPNSKKVYVDKIFDEFSANEHIAYAFNGSTNSHTYGQEPNDPYFAIKHNEEYIAYDLNTEAIMYNNPYTLTNCTGFFDYSDITSNEARITTIGNIAISNYGYDSDSGPGTAEPRSCTDPCDRDCNDGKDAVTRIKFDHDYEGWPRGGPEFNMQYAIGLKNSVSTNNYGFILSNGVASNYCLGPDENLWYFNDSDGDALRSKQMLEWFDDIHSIDMQEYWSENDGSFKEFNIGGTFSVKVKISEILEITEGVNLSYKTIVGGDDEIGSIVVQYCDNWSDNWGYEYIISGVSGDVKIAQLDRDY